LPSASDYINTLAKGNTDDGCLFVSHERFGNILLIKEPNGNVAQGLLPEWIIIKELVGGYPFTFDILRYSN
jgi:hypothetical protein